MTRRDEICFDSTWRACRYNVYPLFAPRRDDVLKFAKTEDDAMNLLESDFATRLPEHIMAHVQRSIPAFLSAVTLALVNDLPDQ